MNVRSKVLLLTAALLFFQEVALCQEAPAANDLRGDYDVTRYELELAVTPETQTLEGKVAIIGVATAEKLKEMQVDLYDLYKVLGVTDGQGTSLTFTRTPDGLVIDLGDALNKGDELVANIHYVGQPKGGGFDGFHWKTSASGQPWINTACQGLGAHYWFPCKASFFHPEDKPEAFYMSVAVPADLYAVGNGKLVEEQRGAFEWFETNGKDYKTYVWQHEYPLETYAASLNIANYTVVERLLEVPGNDNKIRFAYYVLPENAEKAALQFQQVPDLIRIYSEAFGPFPFPDSKFGLVESNVWGMEHSTAVSYGSSYPAWCVANGQKDPYASRNKWFDYILIHEVAHEWWGNGVSAEHWGHFWIHEGFGTYAEGVYVEGTQGRESADTFFKEMGRGVSPTRGALYRGDHPTSGDAYTGIIYSKGATVLHTLRNYVDDDDAWWRALREFNMTFRYGNATTEDFRAVLERVTAKDWGYFFEQWVYGVGTPKLTVEVTVQGTTVSVKVENPQGHFKVPIDLSWTHGNKRLWFEPGENTTTFETEQVADDLQIVHLNRILGLHSSSVTFE